jgi:Flp pilus assembly protein TadD
VAWVSERKDVLSGFFWMLTMMAYVWYVEQPGVKRYLLVVLAFCLGLLSKPMLVTLPFVLLLLDYWPLGRLSKSANQKSSEPTNTHFQWPVFYRLVWEKAPFFVLSAFSSAITFVLQQSAMTPTEELPAKICIANAFISYIKYIGKMFWPSRLAVLYPHPGKAILIWQAMISALLLLAISICVVRLARKYKYLLVGWLWYLGTLVPVIGIVQVGLQAMADRYTYLPSIGIFIMVAWGAAELGARWHFQGMWRGISIGLVLVALLICTRMQVRYWQDNLTLYKHAAEVTENNFIMHTFYGEILYKKGELDEAITHFREALRINPRYPSAGIGLGKALLRKGKFDEAVRCFNAALLTRKDLPDVYGDMGLAYARLYKDEAAVANLIKSIELDPNSAENLNNLAWILATTKDTKLQNPTDAVKYARKACELTGPAGKPAFLDTLAVAYAADGNFPEAVKTAEKAIKLAKDANEENLAEEIQERLNLYKSDRPYRQK